MNDIMAYLEDLIFFLNNINDYYIEVEGNTDKLLKFISKYNYETGSAITIQNDGIRKLSNDNSKWGLEFRLYTNERPQPLLGNRFHRNTVYHTEYMYRLSDNDLVQALLYKGYCLGHN